MPRIRSIKPELATSRKLSQASRDARYTLILLITQADDEGFVLAEPRQLLGNLYPHDTSATVELLEYWLAELIAANSIRFRETRDGARVVELIGWQEHQAIKNPGKPKISPTLLPLAGDSTEDFLEISRKRCAEVGSRKGEVGSRKTEREGESSADLSASFAEEQHRSAYLAYRAQHRFPDGLDAAIRSLAAPLVGGEPVPWERLGAALVEMRAAEVPFTPRALAGFARKVGAPAHGDKAAARQAARDQLEADIAAGRRGEMF